LASLSNCAILVFVSSVSFVAFISFLS
jgi:hypothetical protein